MMKLLIAEKDCLLSELQIPEGYRLLEDWEVLRELRYNGELKKFLSNGFIFCLNHKSQIRAAFLGYNDGNFHIYGDNYLLNLNGRARGVFTKVKE